MYKRQVIKCSRYLTPARITILSPGSTILRKSTSTFSAQERRSLAGILFSVSSYGSIIVVGDNNPYFAERMYHSSAIDFAQVEAFLNQGEIYNSLAGKGELDFLLTQATSAMVFDIDLDKPL